MPDQTIIAACKTLVDQGHEADPKTLLRSRTEGDIIIIINHLGQKFRLPMPTVTIEPVKEADTTPPRRKPKTK